MLNWKRWYSLAAFMAAMIVPESLWSIDNSQSGASEVPVTTEASFKKVAQVESPESRTFIFHATDTNFSARVLNEKLPVLVDYWAEWAGPSKVIAPILAEIAEVYAGRLKVVKLNIDESPQTTQKYGIRGIPTLMLFAHGEIVATKVGALSKEQLVAWLDENLKK